VAAERKCLLGAAQKKSASFAGGLIDNHGPTGMILG
jgi:hypothetical protein